MSNISKYIHILSFTAIAALLAGCADQYWYQKNKTFNQCKDDCIDCRAKSKVYANNFDKSDNFCIEFEEKCMRDKGYKLVSEGWLPIQTKKREPDPLYLEKYGIAGCLAEELEIKDAE